MRLQQLAWPKISALKVVVPFLWLIIVIAAFICIEWPGWGVLATALPIFLWIVFSRRQAAQPKQTSADEQLAERQGARPSFSPTQISLFFYSLVGGLALLGIRQLQGFGSVDPYKDWHVSSMPHEDFLSVKLGHGFFNKFQERAGLLEVLVLCICLFAVLSTILWISKHQKLKIGALQLHPATSLLPLIIVLGMFELPPYNIDVMHWSGFVSIALDASQGIWPYFQARVTYGLLVGPTLLLFLTLFSLTKLTVAVFVMSLSAVAAITIFILISDMAQSKWIGLLGTATLILGFYDLGSSILVPNAGAPRFQVMTALSLLLAWIALRRKDTRGIIAATAFGVLALWYPSHQFFLAAPVFCGLLYQALARKDKIAVKQMIGMAAGAIVPMLLIAFVFSRPWLTDTAGLIARATSGSDLFLAGFGGTPQPLGWADFVWFVFALIGMALLFQRLQSGNGFSPEYLFLLSALLYTVPVVLYHFARTSLISVNALAWVMFPIVILVCRFLWGPHEQTRFYGAVGLISLTFVLTMNIPEKVTIFAGRVLLPFENARQDWTNACLDALYAGKTCKQGPWPDTRQAFTEASTPLIDVNQGTNRALINECQNHIPIYSLIGPTIYWYGHCSIPYRESLVVLDPLPDFEQQLVSSKEVIIDKRIPWSMFSPYIDRIDDVLVTNRFCKEIAVDEDFTRFTKDCDHSSVAARFGDSMQLHEWALQGDVNVKQCSQITVNTLWSFTSSDIEYPFVTFVIANASGNGVSNMDRQFATGRVGPTERIYYRDVRTLKIGCDTPPGDYNVLISAYYRNKGEDPTKLPVTFADGAQSGETLYLTTLHVTQSSR